MVHRVQTLDFPSPWAPFGLLFGSLWLSLGSFLASFGTLWLPLGSLGAVFGPPKHLIASGLKWYILFGSLWLPLGSLFLLQKIGQHSVTGLAAKKWPAFSSHDSLPKNGQRSVTGFAAKKLASIPSQDPQMNPE